MEDNTSSMMILTPRNGWTLWLSTNISILRSYQMTRIAGHHVRGAAIVSDIYLSLIYSFFLIFHFQNFINKQTQKEFNK